MIRVHTRTLQSKGKESLFAKRNAVLNKVLVNMAERSQV